MPQGCVCLEIVRPVPSYPQIQVQVWHTKAQRPDCWAKRPIAQGVEPTRSQNAHICRKGRRGRADERYVARRAEHARAIGGLHEPPRPEPRSCLNTECNGLTAHVFDSEKFTLYTLYTSAGSVL